MRWIRVRPGAEAAARRCAAVVALGAVALVPPLAAEEPGGSAPEGDSRYRVSVEVRAPAGSEPGGEVRIRVESREPWHVNPKAPASLTICAS